MNRIPCLIARRCPPSVTALRRQRGQSSMEYGVICAALAFALFYPIQDAASPGQKRTTAEVLIEGFKTAYQKFSYALSLPY